MESYVVQKWDASYYCWESKIWKNGKLHLCPKYICFFEDNSQPNSALMITEDLRSITGFQRRLVSLIYKAIVVGVEGKDPLWFSSLQNREEVFHFMEHFWKQRLLCLGPGWDVWIYTLPYIKFLWMLTGQTKNTCVWHLATDLLQVQQPDPKMC